MTQDNTFSHRIFYQPMTRWRQTPFNRSVQLTCIPKGEVGGSTGRRRATLFTQGFFGQLENLGPPAPLLSLTLLWRRQKL